MAHRIAATARDTGIGLTLLPVFYAHASFGGVAPTPLQRRFINDVERFALLVDSYERAVAQLLHARTAPHPRAEQTKEVDDCIAWCGMRPVEWLLKEHGLNERWCVIHATHMTADETRALAQSGAVAGLCPVTEANLGDGTFNLPGFTAEGSRYGVGTDSNILVGAAAELRQLEYSQRLATRGRNVAATRVAARRTAHFSRPHLPEGSGARTPQVRAGRGRAR